MRFNDAVIGIFLLIFASAMIAYTTTFPDMPGQRFGPALFPRIVGVGFILCGLILTARGLAVRQTVPWVVLGAWAQSSRHRRNLMLVPAGLTVYILIAGWLGFIPSAILLLFVLLTQFGARVPVAAGVAIVATLAIHTVFARVLLVPLPWGLLAPIAW